MIDVWVGMVAKKILIPEIGILVSKISTNYLIVEYTQWLICG